MSVDKDLKERLSKIETIREELRSAEKSASKDIMEMLKELMKSSPLLEAIKWQQWIPGFNDGDPCEFTIGELYFKLSDELCHKEKSEDDEYDENSDFMVQSDIEDFVESQIDVLNHKQMTLLKKSIKNAQKVFEHLTAMEDQLKEMFGVDMEITVTKDGVETEDHNCGY